MPLASNVNDLLQVPVVEQIVLCLKWTHDLAPVLAALVFFKESGWYIQFDDQCHFLVVYYHLGVVSLFMHFKEDMRQVVDVRTVLQVDFAFKDSLF
jgi:hypothetical protein